MKKTLLVLALCLLIMLAACSEGGSSFTRNSVERTTESSWSMSYAEFDGTRTMTVSPDEGNKAEFDVEITTEDGALALSITDASGKSCYKGSGLPTSAFTVTAEGSGPYEIRFDANHHSGGFAVSWRPSE